MIMMTETADIAAERDLVCEREPFTASRREIICALASYALGYAWTGFSWQPLGLLLTAGLLVLLCEAIQKGVSRSRESLVWLGCFAVCTFSLFVQEVRQYGICISGNWLLMPSAGAWEPVEYGFCRVWDDYQLALFVHVFAVWWVISRSGKLLAGESSRFLPMDALNAFVLVPLGNFFLRIRALWYGGSMLAAGLRRKEDRADRGDTRWWVLLAALLSAVLFIMAGELLSSADQGFAQFYSSIRDLFRLDWEADPETVFRIMASIPVGMYLFGLIAGSARVKRERLDGQVKGIEAFLESIRRVPEVFWTIVIGVFSLLYLAFFVFQARYLFGAFTRTLPEGFIVSQYAREGFFELCKVVALNFSLLWMVTRMARSAGNSTYGDPAVPGNAPAGVKHADGSVLFRAACLALLFESAVFAVIAFSKLALYIDCFGFTPLRFQSIWLVCVLFAACALWAVNLVTGRKVFRYWMYFGAVSLSLLSLY